MATKKDLDTELNDLQQSAVEGDKLYESSKVKLYRNLVDTYLWWRKANMRSGYLDQQYTDKQIRYSKTGNKPNFKPLVRLVFNVPPSKRVTIGNWGSAINAIDDEFIRNQQNYQNVDVAEELVYWIQDNGGTGGITGRSKEQQEEHGYDYKDVGKPKRKKGTSDDKKKQQSQVLSLKKLASSKQKAQSKIDIGAVGTDDDDFVVVLAKSTGKANELKVVGTTASSDIVDTAVMEIAELEYANAPYSLKLLCEALRINTIPKSLQNYGARSKFYPKSKVTVDDNGDQVAVGENTRLVCRANGTVLVSKSTTKASLVTIITPKTKFNLEEDVWLRGSDRYYIETDLIHDAEIALFDASPTSNLADVKNTKIKAVKQLSLKNTESKQTRNLYFYDFSRVDEDTLFQPTICDEEIKWQWEIVGKKSYFARLYSQHFSGWVHRVKHRIHIKANKHVRFVANKDGIICEKKWLDNEYTQTGNRYLTSYGDDAELKKGNKTNKFQFAPTDLMQALEFISKTDVKGNVTMKANEHIMLVTFKNDVGTFDVFIPSTSNTGKRNDTCFKKFIANE